MRTHRALVGLLAVGALVAPGCGEPGSAQAADTDLPAVSGEDAASSTAPATPLFSSDFETVCVGASESRAAAYSPGEGGPHPMILLQGAKGELYEQTVDIPADWRIDWSPDRDALADVELVVCSTATPGDVVRTCDGYEGPDGNPTAQSVALRNATYDVVVRAARTGEQVAATTISATTDSCPLVVSSDTTEHLATDNLAIVEWLAPIVQG